MMRCQLLLHVVSILAVAVSASSQYDPRQAKPQPGQLENFQVYEPVMTPLGQSDQYGCIYTMVLMEYNFENSYGKPFVGQYNPPPCIFNRVTINLTVTSQGRQFDRIAIMYLGDVEVFRTSTAEPTKNGIIWNYVKEMQMYNALWKSPQTVIYDEGNIIDDTYTGPFNTTLTATFFTIPDSPATADLILPITSRQGSNGKSSVFQIPDQNATVAHILPRNINRAIVSLSATGQIGEEFWYSNVPTSRINTFANTTGGLLGGGTFREVQLYIDGHLSGVSWPFPVIFTGGIVPGLWRPIVGIDTFDLRQHEIDITPWLGYLLDGKSHTFTIRVASVNDDGKGKPVLAGTPSYWLVTGTIFVFLDEPGSVTTGSLPTINTPAIDLSSTSSVTQDQNGQNNTLTYSTQARRALEISALITTAKGTFPASWSQQLVYRNKNQLTQYGRVQYTDQDISGHDLGTGASPRAQATFANTYDFPLTVNSSYLQSADGSSLSLEADLSHGKSLLVLGNPIFPTGLQNFNTTRSSQPTVFPIIAKSSSQSEMVLSPNTFSKSNYPTFQGSVLKTTQTGSASYFSNKTGSYSFGTTEQYYTFGGTRDGTESGNVELYNRHVKAVNTTVVLDEQTLLGKQFGIPLGQVNSGSVDVAEISDEPGRGIRSLLGRGPDN